MKLLGLGGIATKLVPNHEDTTRHARALYPAQAQRAFPSTGIAIGRDAISGEVACFDPWQWYADGLLTSPALFVMGEVGMGKSAFVKALILRSCGMGGREVYLLDPKSEYAPVARALGLPSLRLEPGGPVRLNPLEPGPSDATPEALARRRASIASALASVGLERSLRPGEEAALFEAAFRLPPQAILPDLVDLLLSPTDDLVLSRVSSARVHTATLSG